LIQHSWSELEGQALENYRFRLAEDPRLLWPIEQGKAAPDTFLAIIQYYEFEGERLPCCICNRAIHNAGAVVHLADHTLRLVGSCCGRKHFGSTWELEKNAFERAERTALNQRRARNILTQRSTLEAQLYRLREPISRIESARRELKKGFAERFHSVSTELLRSSGRLSYVEGLGGTVTDQGGDGALRNLERETQPILGWELFSLADKRKGLEQAISAMKHCLENMRDALDRTRVTYKHIRTYQDCRDRLIGIVDLHNQTARYGHAQNASTFNFWFSKRGFPLVIDARQDGWVFRSPSSTTHARVDEWTPIEYPGRLVADFEVQG
jgi:hypothetical protein